MGRPKPHLIYTQASPPQFPPEVSPAHCKWPRILSRAFPGKGAEPVRLPVPKTSGESDGCSIAPWGSSGANTLHTWPFQKTLEGPCTPISPASNSRRASSTSTSIDDALQQLRLTDVEPHSRGTGKRKAAESGHPRSSPKAGNPGSNVQTAGNLPRVSKTKHSHGGGTPGVKHGQRNFDWDDKPRFVCPCCMRLILSLRARGMTRPGNLQTCRPVENLRSVCRYSRDRHVNEPDHIPINGEYIDKEQYDSLDGEAYRSARDLAREKGLGGRAKDEFIWRELVVFLYPHYTRVQEQLDPYHLDQAALSKDTLRDIEFGLGAAVGTPVFPTTATPAPSAAPPPQSLSHFQAPNHRPDRRVSHGLFGDRVLANSSPLLMSPQIMGLGSQYESHAQGVAGAPRIGHRSLSLPLSESNAVRRHAQSEYPPLPGEDDEMASQIGLEWGHGGFVENAQKGPVYGQQPLINDHPLPSEEPHTLIRQILSPQYDQSTGQTTSSSQTQGVPTLEPGTGTTSTRQSINPPPAPAAPDYNRAPVEASPMSSDLAGLPKEPAREERQWEEPQWGTFDVPLIDAPWVNAPGDDEPWAHVNPKWLQLDTNDPGYTWSADNHREEDCRRMEKI